MPVIATGLDYSARRLSGASIRAAGYTFVNRYLWFPGQRWPALTADEYRDLTANGIEVHAIYEQDTNDPAGGWNAGVAMARQAVQSAQAAGLPPGTTIYMCADAWLSTHGIPVSTAMSFLDGARSVLAPAGYLTGAYGFRDFVHAAQDGGHADRFWLCGAESGVRAGIHQYQWNNGRVYVDGLECDLNKQYLPMTDRAPGGDGGGNPDEDEDDMIAIHEVLPASSTPRFAKVQCPVVGASEPLPDGEGTWAQVQIAVPHEDAQIWGVYAITTPGVSKGRGEAVLLVGPGVGPSGEVGEQVEAAPLGYDLYVPYWLPRGTFAVTVYYSSAQDLSVLITGGTKKKVSA